MKENWQAACDHVIVSEGGYKLTDIPGDNGGQTYAGIARKPNPDWDGWAYVDRGEEPPKELVQAFYKARFWDKVHGDDLPAGVDYLAYDFAVNAGTRASAKLLQRAVGVQDDGAIGPGTIAAIEKVDASQLIEDFSHQKSEFYQEIVEKNPVQQKFLKGWLNRVAQVKGVAEGMVA